MFSPLPRAGAILTAGALVASAGCKESLSPDRKVALIDVAPKTARLYTVGQQVEFSAELTTEAGTLGEGIPIQWIARDPSLIQVSSTGVATSLKKGGSTYVVASAGGKSDSAFVEVPSTPCGTVPSTALTVGQVATEVGAAGFCSAASSGLYAVIVHNNSLSGSGSASVDISGVAIGSPPASGASLSRAASPFGPDMRLWRRDVSAEMRRRRAEAMEAAPFAAGARAWYANRRKGATFTKIPPAVGDVMSINVNVSGSGCSATPTLVNARVAAVSNSAIILHDPRNPAGGFTDADYNVFAGLFDSDINPLGVTTFGAPTDLDDNGRVLIVFTRSVNELTPANSADSYVGGLTHSRDLLPKAGSPTSQVCPGSNEAEMFYLLAPDPTGVAGNKWDTAFVNSVTPATITHEFQHLINFARRRYINGSNGAAPQPAEELWLNEGLSHMAEELLYYRRTAKAPRTNIGGSVIFASQPTFADWVDDMSGNFINYFYYVSDPASNGPLIGTDGIETRGATWAFLRYLADQKFAADGSLWFNLVNSGETGATNLQNRLGIDAAGLRGSLRDFTIALYADDFVGSIAPKYTQPSWDNRSISAGLRDFAWPLVTVGLKETEINPATIRAGGFKVFRFTGLSSVDAYIRVTGTAGSALPAGITVSVVRTQ